MHIMSAIVGKLNQIFPEVVPQVASGKARKTVSDDAEIAAAIVAAMFKK
jgi:Na+-transporting methylmalonyl-CoA/oxaloacetate decarboxylase gamma subunit